MFPEAENELGQIKEHYAKLGDRMPRTKIMMIGGIVFAIVLASFSLSPSFALALALPSAFTTFLGLYYLVTLAYSLWLKGGPLTLCVAGGGRKIVTEQYRRYC